MGHSLLTPDQKQRGNARNMQREKEKWNKKQTDNLKMNKYQNYMSNTDW